MNKISRKLTNLEKGLELFNLRGSTFNIVIINKISGILSTDLVRQALDALQEQTPFLQCRIAESNQDLYLTTESTTKIPLQVIKKKETDLQDIVEEELNKTIDSSKYLIRTTAICNQTIENIEYLVTTVHHGIADGRSCMALHE